MALRPASSNDQNCSGVSAPPGKRQPIPTMAIGSERARSNASSFALVCSSATKARFKGES